MKLNRIAVFFIVITLFIACSEDEPTPESNIVITPFEATIDENPDVGTVIGNIEVTGAEGSLQYILSAETPSGAMAISNNGELSVADPALFDFETNPQLTATVEVTADNGTATSTITVNLNNINESLNLTIWDGPAFSFTKANGADPLLEANQDRISESVWLTRANDGGQIYNAKSETTANKSTSPAGTKWALGTTDEIESLTFSNFRTAVGDPKGVVGKDLVLYLEAEDVYLSVKFTSWNVGKTNGGGFAYSRSTQKP